MRKTLDQIVEVVKEQHPYAWTWQEDVLRNWVRFYCENNLLIPVSYDMVDIAGLIMFRLVMKPKDGTGNSMNYDPEGNVIWVDFVWAPTNEILRALTIAVIKQIGRRQTVAWERHGTLRLYPASRYVCRILKGEIYGSA